MRQRTEDAHLNQYQRAHRRELDLIEALAQGQSAAHFVSHRSAALMWGAPMPWSRGLDLHLSVLAPRRAPRIAGVHGHRFESSRCRVDERNGVLLSSAASTWAMLGELSLFDLVAVGDYLVRVNRAGYGRPNAGVPALTTVAEMQHVLALGRWEGMVRLRQALTLIREDSWSPRETTTRLTLVLAGLPEPELNRDVFDKSGCFLACLDLAFVDYKVAVEYQGELHAGSYAEDVERIERLRAEGWIVLQVTRTLARQPRALVERVAAALRERGWEDRRKGAQQATPR